MQANWKVGNATAVLGHTEADLPISGFLPSVQGMVDSVARPRQAAMEFLPRGNKSTSFSITVKKQHASFGDALLYLATETRDRVLQQGTIELSQLGSAGGSKISMAGAVCLGARAVKHAGCTTFIEYSFNGGVFS